MRTIVKRPRRRWFADLKAEGLAWWVRTAADQRLQSVMRSRLRSVLLWAIFRTIRQRAQPNTRVNAVVEFSISGRRDGGIDRYQLTFIDGRCTTSRHAGRKPALTLKLEPVAFLRLVGGTASPQRLLIAGKLKLHGDLMLALALPATLRIPRRRPQAPARKR
jgi:putative sterol carrier protein